MHKLYYLCFSFWMLCLPAMLHAQAEAPVEMADGMRSSGKIYVVVAVILTLFAGIVLYLVNLDRKITRLEKETGAGNNL